MTPEFQTVLEIAGVGTVLLFLALAGLVGLMYLLTMPRPFRQSSDPEGDTAQTTKGTREELEAAEHDRQQQAVAIAVAVACAQAARPATFVTDAPSDWRRLHRSRRLGQRPARARART